MKSKKITATNKASQFPLKSDYVEKTEDKTESDQITNTPKIENKTGKGQIMQKLDTEDKTGKSHITNIPETEVKTGSGEITILLEPENKTGNGQITQKPESENKTGSGQPANKHKTEGKNEIGQITVLPETEYDVALKNKKDRFTQRTIQKFGLKYLPTNESANFTNELNDFDNVSISLFKLM